MLKALLQLIMKLFAYLLVLHLGVDNMLLPPPPPPEGNILYTEGKTGFLVKNIIEQSNSIDLRDAH